MRTFAAVLIVFLGAVASARPARAQAEPAVGVRAAGMGGAFVGVADDASAVFWNPAGLASGAFFSLVLDGSSVKPGEGVDAPQGSTFLVGVGTPPLGAAYYRLEFPVAVGPAAESRNKTGVETLVTQQFAATVDQSLRDGLAIGATVRAVRGRTAVETKTAADADFGVMLSGQAGRIGVAVRNAFEPEFTTPLGIARLERRVRGGFSLLFRGLVRVAADSDFTTAIVPGGRWRDAAVGAELQPMTVAWIRGGVHWNTAGGDLGTAPIVSIGGSAAVYGSLMVDAQVSAGSKNGSRGWGAGLRYNF